MSNISGTQIVLYFAGIILVLFLLGLVGTKYLTFDTSNDNPYVVENLVVPNVASSGEVSGGSSELYGWGYTPITKPKANPTSRNCPSCKHVYIDNPDTCNTCQSGPKDCRYADITRNVDIDKYVLKSSIPPCPDLTEYAKKNQIPPYPFNKTDWVLKSSIPPCPPMQRLDNYVLKSSIVKQECPKIPECPSCPLVPNCKPNIKVVTPSPEAWGSWTPKLSETTSGLIPSNVSMSPSISISRGMDTMPQTPVPTGFSDFPQTNY